jgi:hypothetical protein
MQAQPHAELPLDCSGWPEELANPTRGSIFGLHWKSRTLWMGVAGVTALLLLGYGVSRSSSATSAPSVAPPALASVSAPALRSNDLEGLRAAFSEQNATNQQIVAAIDALRAEQQEMRKQISAMQAAARHAAGVSGSSGITGSITPRPQAKAPAPAPAPRKPEQQADARPVPYPSVPYPPRQN